MALKIADKEFTSRLFTGTGKFASNQLMEDAILASESQLVTVALKRVNMDGKDDDILAHLKAPHITLLPNTSGVRTAKEAVFAAQLAREALGTNWLKLEIHPDPKYLLPDPIETLKATEELAKLGFVVLPYIQADPVLCKHLENAGAATVMPLGAPIGTKKTLTYAHMREGSGASPASTRRNQQIARPPGRFICRTSSNAAMYSAASAELAFQLARNNQLAYEV